MSANFNISSWKKNNQAGEIDFIVNKGKATYAIEVKSSLKLNKKYFSSLIEYSNFYSKSTLILTNLDRGGRYLTNKGVEVLNIPLYQLFAWMII